MNRLMPLAGLLALAALTTALVACSSGGGTEPAGASANATAGTDDADGGLGVAAVCAEGVPDCQDTIVAGDEGAPDLCGEGATAPECVGEDPPLEPGVAPGGVAYRVTVDFDDTYTDASIDPVLAILQSADPGAGVVIQERFPPAAVATINSNDEEFCAVTEEQLLNVAGVAKVACDVAVDVPLQDPDAPVSNP